MIPVMSPVFLGNEKKYLNDCLKSSWISSSGKYIDKFEEKFAEYIGTKYATTCSNGTCALHLALLAFGVNQGDEVILPNLSFVATANSVKYVGATPVFVDIVENTWNINTDLIESKITVRTKAIIVVHLYGNPCHMTQVLKVAKKYNLLVIEDCAQAHGATWKNKKVGSIGDIGCFSFFGNKIITTGEGGMVTTNNKNIIDKINFYKNHGMDINKRYWHPDIGYNYRMTNMQAAIGLAQLECIDKIIVKKSNLFNLYKKYLGYNVSYQSNYKQSNPVTWLVTFCVKDRDNIINKLKTNNIDSRSMFYPMNKFPMFNNEDNYRISEKVSKFGISVPSSINLTEKQVKYICKILLK